MKQIFNLISTDLINLAIEDYSSKNDYDTAIMNKASPDNIVKFFTPLFEDLLNKKLNFKSGNYYKHTKSYLPHTDYRIEQNNLLNVVIPLKFSGEQASLVIFDQMWYNNSVTWCLSNSLLNFSINTGIIGNPCDYKDVVGLTKNDIDFKFWIKYLRHYPRKCFFGLTGSAFLFEPASIIMFDNRHIHCTSIMKGEKLGLSLRYSYDC